MQTESLGVIKGHSGWPSKSKDESGVWFAVNSTNNLFHYNDISPQIWFLNQLLPAFMLTFCEKHLLISHLHSFKMDFLLFLCLLFALAVHYYDPCSLLLFSIALLLLEAMKFHCHVHSGDKHNGLQCTVKFLFCQSPFTQNNYSIIIK